MFFTFQKRRSQESAPSRPCGCCLLLLFMWLLPVWLETHHRALETVVMPCGQRELLEHFCGQISWEKTFLSVISVQIERRWIYSITDIISQKGKKKGTQRGGGRGGGGAHLCFTSASCYVAPYLGLQRTFLPSHKSLHQGLLFIKHALYSVPSSREQQWKYIVILWPGFKEQYSIHSAANAQ